jgi:hypothetical protein
MTWVIHHRQSEQWAVDAEYARKRGEEARAVELYKQAAEAEERALVDLDPAKIRTLGVTAVSAASLWFKGTEFLKAQIVAYKWLATNQLPPFAIEQLQNLLQTIWTEVAIRESGIRFTGEEVLVSVKGGEIVHGGAPLDLIQSKIREIGVLFSRTVEFLMQVPHRKHGPPSMEVQKFYRPWLLQAPAGSYQFAVRIEEPGQIELPSIAKKRPHADQVASMFLDIVKASAEDPEGTLPAVVPDPEYRSTFIKMTRNLAPTGEDFKRLEIRPISLPVSKPVILVPEVREIIRRTVLRWTPRKQAEKKEKKVRMEGILRALHLDQDWIEITVRRRGEPEKHIRIDGAGDQVDDVLGPMVNRPVIVETTLIEKRKKPFYTLKDIQPAK